MSKTCIIAVIRKVIEKIFSITYIFTLKIQAITMFITKKNRNNKNKLNNVTIINVL